MIKYNDNTINKWYHDGELIKVYYHGAVCYYKLTPSGQTPCFAVVADISQYTDREFVDVFNQADGKWYKLNNLNQYEEYGVYGSGRNITYYDGKLTIDDGYEYQYSGNSWVNVGEVSGSTASLPDVSFVLNYNAKDYDTTTHSIPQTSGQTKGIDAICNYNPNNIVDHSSDGYISVTGDTRLTVSGGTTSLGRNNTQTGCTMTIVSKALGEGSNSSNYSLFTCRGRTGVRTLCWMYRQYTDYVRLHGKVDSPTLSCSSSSPSVLSVKTYYDGGVKSLVKNWTDNTTTGSSYQYYNNYANGALFCDYLTHNAEFWRGDFYWLYMSHEVLTDEQIQQVIDYNEEGGGEPIYPIYYDEIQDPPNNLSFSSMTEAEEYECPWVGMHATIAGSAYTFNENYEWELMTEVWVNAPDTIANYIVESSSNRKITEWVTGRKFPKKIVIDKGTSGDGSWCWGWFYKTDETEFLSIPTSTEMYFKLNNVSYQLSNPSSFPPYITYENGILTVDLEAANLYGSVYFSGYQKNFLIDNVDLLFDA